MEQKKQFGSSSSFTSELFGSKETASTTNEILKSIFSPSFKNLGEGSQHSEVSGKTLNFLNETWYSKTEDNYKRNEWKSHNISSRERSSICQEHNSQPCHLSSSIYYGGQDVYSQPHGSQNPEQKSTLKKDGSDQDDSGCASRGNWWEGSLYY